MIVLVANSACVAPRLGSPLPQAIVVLPPGSARLDPLVPQTAAGMREADRKLMVDVVETAVPLEIHDRLVARGVRPVLLRREQLSASAGEPLDQLEERLSYAGMARANQADRVLKLAYDGAIRRGAGSVEALGGLIAFDYPSDTSWFELRLAATLIDPANAENTQQFEVSGERHTELVGMLSGSSERDRVTDLARDLVDQLVDEMLGP
ncbi:MAG: hypothetical protein IPK07_03915 [Deltaproteobacteria bacterium]|nr:hypothetical protein [Deltaproteobacteria bacterium]